MSEHSTLFGANSRIQVSWRTACLLLLTFVSGVTDALGLLKLGGVFTSVMTGNMVLLGVSGVRHDGSIAVHTTIALVSYVVGSVLGTRLARQLPDDERSWPSALVVALCAEFAAFAVFAIAWEATDGRPSVVLAAVLLGTNAIALGIQSAAVLVLSKNTLSTTYLTGMLTNVIVNLTNKNGFKAVRRSVAVMVMLIVGAMVGAFTALHASLLIPLFQEGAIALVIVVGWRHTRRTHRDKPALDSAPQA